MFLPCGMIICGGLRYGSKSFAFFFSNPFLVMSPRNRDKKRDIKIIEKYKVKG